MNEDESIFVKCNCGTCNILEFNHDSELDSINIAVWVSHPGQPTLSLKERLRWCRHVMKTGKPWADHTIVDRKDAQRIVEFLTKYLNHGKA